MNKNDFWEKIKRSIIDGNKANAVNYAQEAVELQLDLNAVIESGYVPGIQEVGDKWENGEYFLPELITSAECMKAAMDILQPEMEKSNIKAHSQGRVIIGTIAGDIHDIGKNLVASLLSANGFEVIDLGADVKLQDFIQTAQDREADLICMSALLTTTMLGQRRLIELLREQNLYGRFRVMVGGAPVNQQWAQDIGAHGYAENAMTAVQAAKNLL